MAQELKIEKKEQETGKKEREKEQTEKVGNEVVEQVIEAQEIMDAELEKEKEEEKDISTQKERAVGLGGGRESDKTEKKEEKKLDEQKKRLIELIESGSDCDEILEQIANQIIKEFGDNESRRFDYIEKLYDEISKINQSSAGGMAVILRDKVGAKLGNVGR